jgi:hypothetical protein
MSPIYKLIFPSFVDYFVKKPPFSEFVAVSSHNGVGSFQSGVYQGILVLGINIKPIR